MPSILDEQEGKAMGSPGVDGAGAIKVYGQKPSTRDPVDAFKSFRISQDDPCHKVLPAALKKYKINDDWRQYALFICYGNTGTFHYGSMSLNTQSWESLCFVDHGNGQVHGPI